MKAFLSKAAAALVVCSVALLAACGGGGDSAPAVATSTVATANLNTPITATNAVALSNLTQTFITGIPEFGTTGTTTLVFTSTGTGTATSTDFKIASNEGTASGKVIFGSCIFNFTASTIPGLVAPRTITIQNCNVNVPTSGGVANSPTIRLTTFTLGALTGTGSSAVVTINANGDVTIGGVLIGRVAVTVTTGAGS